MTRHEVDTLQGEAERLLGSKVEVVSRTPSGAAQTTTYSLVDVKITGFGKIHAAGEEPDEDDMFYTASAVLEAGHDRIDVFPLALTLEAIKVGNNLMRNYFDQFSDLAT